ncbi:MAG: YMGG-like glycine zipper-containing protein [Candidatus Acidiferrales bacterium]
MNRITKFLLLALLVALAVTPAAADRLELKDGRVLDGTYVGGSRVNVHFRVDGQTKIYKRTEVSAIFLEEEGAASVNRPASASAATTTSQSTGTRAATATAGGTIPAGTALVVRMIDGVDSEKNQPGDTFRASIEDAITINNAVAVPQGAEVIGRLTAVEEAGKLTGKSELKLELTAIVIRGQSYNLTTGEYGVAGKSRGKDTAVKAGTGAAVGAIIGAIAGGGKGAAIGAGVGAGAGTAVQVFTKGEQVRVPSETLLEFTLQNDLSLRRPSTRR